MKRGLIIVSLILLALPQILAATSFFDGRMYDTEPKEFDGIQLRVASSYSKSAITYGTHKFVVYINKCTDDSYYEVCLRKTEDNLFSEFSISQKGLDITFTKSKDPSTTLAVNDPVTIKLEVSNAGELPLDFSIVDDVSNLDVTNVEDVCYKEGNKIIFNYTVRGTDTVACSYRARVVKVGKESKKAVMTYFDGTKIQTIEQSVSLKAENYGFNLELLSDRSSYDVGDLILITLKASNTFKGSDTDSTIGEVKIENIQLTSSGFSLIESNSKFSQGRNYFELNNYDIAAETIQDFIFKFNITKIKNEFIITSRSLTQNGYKDILFKKTIDVASIKPDITLQRISDTQFKVHIENINKNRAMRNFRLSLKSNYQNFDLSRTFSVIPAAGKAIVDINLKNFDSRPTTTYPLFATGTYETEFGEAFPFSKTMQIDLRQELTSPPVNVEPETTVVGTQVVTANETVNNASKFSFSSFFKKLFGFLSFKKSDSNETKVEVPKEQNITSKSLKEKLLSLKPSKRTLIIIGSVVGVIIIIGIIFLLIKRHKRIKHIEVKLQDVKL